MSRYGTGARWGTVRWECTGTSATTRSFPRNLDFILPSRRQAQKAKSNAESQNPYSHLRQLSARSAPAPASKSRASVGRHAASSGSRARIPVSRLTVEATRRQVIGAGEIFGVRETGVRQARNTHQVVYRAKSALVKIRVLCVSEVVEKKQGRDASATRTLQTSQGTFRCVRASWWSRGGVMACYGWRTGKAGAPSQRVYKACMGVGVREYRLSDDGRTRRYPCVGMLNPVEKCVVYEFLARYATSLTHRLSKMQHDISSVVRSKHDRKLGKEKVGPAPYAQ